MKIISVTGSHSGVGKTSLASLIIREIEGLSAIKVTKTDLFTSITTDDEIISESGKDSAVFKESGARNVVWVKSTQRDLKECLNQALSMVSDSRGVVIEGNSPIEYIEPDLIIFVMKEDLSGLKASGSRALERADLVVINTDSNSIQGENIERLKIRLIDINPDAEIFSNDLAGGKIQREFLDFVKKRIGMVYDSQGGVVWKRP